MTEPGTEETGLNLIHDTASAAGSFPHSVWGYDRQTVDSYVQELEQQLSAAKQLIRHMQREVVEAKRLSEASDFTKLGGHTTQMLQAAEAQSRELLDQANQEAERIKAEGRRLAAEARASGEQEADDIRLNAQATFKKMRAEVDIQCARELDRARDQATSILASAKAQVDHQLGEAERAAKALAEGAGVEADRIAQAATTQALRTKLAAEQEREELLTRLAEEHTAASTRIATLLENSRAETESASQRLQDEVTQAAELRRKALAEGEEIKVTAVREAEVQIAKAHAQASLLRDRAEEQFGWRKEQLERETNRLLHRKQAIMAQLANLSAMAEHSLAEFPDLLAASEPEVVVPDTSANEPTTAVPFVPASARPVDPDATVSLPVTPAPTDDEIGEPESAADEAAAEPAIAEATDVTEPATAETTEPTPQTSGAEPVSATARTADAASRDRG
ncbi:hypothetical protein [Propionicicella superfundia]|uniref:hypothetical protein n=1 Tax=Propionicicella superfundia TaxID=348582 RepID=UPI0003FBC842|nr:hypothetical protein [Propionicicella superfundia]